MWTKKLRCLWSDQHIVTDHAWPITDSDSSFVQSWRPCCSAEFVKHYHSTSVTVLSCKDCCTNLLWPGVVVSALGSINQVNLRRTMLVLRWATVYVGFNSWCWTFISVCNQPATKVNSVVHPCGVGKWVPASAGKAKTDMVHPVSGWTRGVHRVQVNLWDLLRTCAIPERLRGVFTTRRYTNARLPYLTYSRTH